MPGEPLALSTVPPPATADTDYDAICAAVTATARGRWFLDEFAKRNRHSDTTQVLAAIARMEASVVGDRVQQASRHAHQEVRVELLEMARTIAQTRAAVAESRPVPSEQLAAAPGSDAAPDVTAAAERLRQIAWTMRAVGIDLPASDQIGQIADTILSADALRNLGDQRAHKLSEVLHYLEHRIDRMLDSHLAAAAAPAGAASADDDPVANANGANDNDHHPDTAVLTQAGPVTAAAATLEAEAPIEPASFADTTASVTGAGSTEYAMDDDVVLTVTERADPPQVESEPLAQAAIAPEPTNAPALPDIEIFEPQPTVVAADSISAATSIASQAVPVPDIPVAPLQGHPAEQATAPYVAPVTTQAAAQGAPQAASRAPDPHSVAAQTAAVVDTGFVAAAAPAAEPRPSSAGNPNAIAIQVEQDLDELTDVAPVSSSSHAAPAQHPPTPADSLAAAARADEPADFLLETPVAAAPPDQAPMAALVASAQATRAQLSSALAAIETELSAVPAPAPVHTDTATVTRPAHADGPLAALMRLSDEERLALFS